MRDYQDFMNLSKANQTKVINLLYGKEISEYELDQEYCEMLDDCYGEVEIAGYTYATTHALARVDPVAFRCGFADWLGTSEDIIELQGDYYRLSDFDEAMESIEGEG